MTPPDSTSQTEALPTRPPLQLSAWIEDWYTRNARVAVFDNDGRAGTLTVQRKYADQVVALLNGGLELVTASQALLAGFDDPSIPFVTLAGPLNKFRTALRRSHAVTHPFDEVAADLDYQLAGGEITLEAYNREMDNLQRELRADAAEASEAALAKHAGKTG